MLNALVTDLIQEIENQVRVCNIRDLHDLRYAPHRVARLSSEMEEKRQQAKSYLYANLYLSSALLSEHEHAAEVVQTLFAAWTEDPELLPPDHQTRAHEEGAPRAVADYIAGMTDAYIEQAWLKNQNRL
jgi:dGTPase